MRDGTASRALVRSRDGRMLAGVCAGVAGYFGLDVTLVRVIWAVVAVLTGGAGVLAYLAAWPSSPVKAEEPDRREHRQQEAGRLDRLTVRRDRSRVRARPRSCHRW